MFSYTCTISLRVLRSLAIRRSMYSFFSPARMKNCCRAGLAIMPLFHTAHAHRYSKACPHCTLNERSMRFDRVRTAIE